MNEVEGSGCVEVTVMMFSSLLILKLDHDAIRYLFIYASLLKILILTHTHTDTHTEIITSGVGLPRLKKIANRQTYRQPFHLMEREGR